MGYSAGVLIDAVRAAKIAKDRGIGPVVAASAYLMKSPPKQLPDDVARAQLEEFIIGVSSRYPSAPEFTPVTRNFGHADVPAYQRQRGYFAADMSTTVAMRRAQTPTTLFVGTKVTIGALVRHHRPSGPHVRSST